MVNPVVGCWVRDDEQREGVVVELRQEHETTWLKFQWGPSSTAWMPAIKLRSGFRPGFHVEHVPPTATARSLGVGVVQATRQLAGCDQVLVQFFETGHSLWLPFQVLRRVKPIENRLPRQETGPYEDHAERFRLRALAYALQAWDQNTGALGRLDIDPLPHQIHVAHQVVSSGNPNWLVADDVGLGKTIEVGLILHALAQRNQCRRVLIVCPAGLVRQWQDEMRFKFDQIFEIYGLDFFVNDVAHWRLREKVIVSLDLAKRDDHRDLLRAAGTWDVVIFDEAHRLGRDEQGKRNLRYRLAEDLRRLTPALLLLTATPHQGKTARFTALLELVRPDLVDEFRTLEANPEVVADVVIRNVKTKVTDARGQPIFNGHDTHRVRIKPSEATRQFAAALERYLKHGYAVSARSGNRGIAIGFVMTTYRKLASSSIAAIASALERRLERLSREVDGSDDTRSIERLVDEGAFESNDDPIAQGELFDQRAFFEDEAAMIIELLDVARTARADDEKLERFLAEVVRPLIESGENLLVFTEYRATQTYLADAIEMAVPDAGEPGLINGSMSLDDKIGQVSRFSAGETRVLVSTEAGGEGLNLQQSCHVMVNYDLPWNPSRLVQRLGRLYRYGQTRRVVVFNLMTEDSFDNKAIALMLERVETIARDIAAVQPGLRDTIEADVLGNLLDGVDLESILENATEMRMELTEAQVDDAIARAKEARQLQDEILSYASSYEAEGRSTGVDSRHVRSFVEAMLPRAGVRIRNRLHGARAIEVQLPEDQVGLYPELGRRRVVALSFDRQLARERTDLFPVDFDSSLVKGLVAMARDRRFDGLYAGTATPATDHWFGFFFLRWQDLRGAPLDDELMMIRVDAHGRARRLTPDELGRLLLEPLDTAPPPKVPGDLDVVQRLHRAAERTAADGVARLRQPGALFLVAAAGASGHVGG